MSRVFLPQSLEQVWEICSRESEVAFYAGGTDFLVKMRADAKAPPCVVCLERVQELHGVRDDGDEVFIAAATTHSRLLEEPLIAHHAPVLAQAISVLGSPPVRHMGTIGGNIVTASPAGDSLPPLYALGAEVLVRSPVGARRVAIKDFILGPSVVDLESVEILAGVIIKKQPPFTVNHYEKVGRRKAQACAVASLAALLRVSEDGVVRKARLAWGSVGPTVITVSEAERRLTGMTLSLESLEEAAELVERAVSPIDDIRASADYRRKVAGRLLLRLCAMRVTRTEIT